MTKVLKIFLIVLLSLIFIGLGVALYFFIKGDFSFSFNHNVSTTKFIEEEYTENFEEIKIESTAGDIEIKKSDSDKIKVIVYSEEKDPTVNASDGKLKVTTSKKKCRGFCFNRKIDKVELYLPSEYENKIIIDNKYGDVELGSFNNLNIEAEMDAGDIKGESVNNIDVNMKYGDLKIKKVNTLKAKLDCGDIKIEKLNNYIDADLSKGDIKIENLSLDKNSSVKTDMGDIKIEHAEGIYVDAHTDMGDVKVNNNDRQSEIELKAETNLGDIKVNY